MGRWLHVLWTAGLFLTWLVGFCGLGVWGAATLLGCTGDCSTGNDWAWSVAVVLLLVALPVLVGFVVVAWVRARGSREVRARWLGYATAVLATAALLAVVALLFLPTGRGPV